MFRGDAKSWMFLSLIFILATTSCTHRSPRVNQSGFPEKDYQYQKPELIPEDWETASIKEANIDSAKMNEMMQEILGGNDRNLHSILIVKNGKLVFEEYFYEYDRERLHYLASVSKSITSILVGIAMEQSPSDGVEKMVYEFFPEYSHTMWIDQKYPITLQHVLTMSAGLDWDASKYSRKDPRHTTHQMYDSDDPAEFVLDRNTIRVAGDKFYYNS